MNDTREILSQRGYPRSLPACPVLLLSVVTCSRGAGTLRRIWALGRNASREISRPGGAPAPSLRRPSMAMAYSLRAHSRLECSPKFHSVAAYHTTSCKFRRNTNRCRDKKSPGLPAPCSAARWGRPRASVWPVGPRRRRFARSGRQGRRMAQDFLTFRFLYSLDSQRGLPLCLILYIRYNRSRTIFPGFPPNLGEHWVSSPAWRPFRSSPRCRPLLRLPRRKSHLPPPRSLKFQLLPPLPRWKDRLPPLLLPCRRRDARSKGVFFPPPWRGFRSVDITPSCNRKGSFLNHISPRS